MAAASFPRIADVKNSSGTIVVTVPWTLTSGTPGFGASGLTQSGTATYTITLTAPEIPTLDQMLDALDSLARAGFAVIT